MLMELGTAAKYILTPNGETPIGDKYFYRESQGLWFVVTLIERKETDERVSLTLQIEDILWRKGRHDIGDSFTCTCTKNFYYPIWWILRLADGLQDFIDNIPNIEKTKEKYPDLDLDTEKDRIQLIKIANGENFMEIEKQMANAFTAHCRPRSCGRQRAVSHPSNTIQNENINDGTKKACR